MFIRVFSFRTCVPNSNLPQLITISYRLDSVHSTRSQIHLRTPSSAGTNTWCSVSGRRAAPRCSPGWVPPPRSTRSFDHRTYSLRRHSNVVGNRWRAGVGSWRLVEFQRIADAAAAAAAATWCRQWRGVALWPWTTTTSVHSARATFKITVTRDFKLSSICRAYKAK